MSLKTLVTACALLVSATAFASAQSLPNYGPNAPANGDSFGKPYSGAQPLREKGSRYSYRHHRAHRTARSSSQSQTEGAAPSK
jgi:hypothetical protein